MKIEDIRVGSKFQKDGVQIEVVGIRVCRLLVSDMHPAHASHVLLNLRRLNQGSPAYEFELNYVDFWCQVSEWTVVED